MTSLGRRLVRVKRVKRQASDRGIEIAQSEAAKASEEDVARRHGGGYDWLQAPPQALQESSKGASKGLALFTTLLVICLTSIIYNVLHNNGPLSPRSAVQTTEAYDSTAPRQEALKVGDDGIITRGYGKNFLLASTLQDEIDMVGYADTGDKVDYAKVVDSHRVYRVPSGTKARLIGTASGFLGDSVCHVRIESGSRKTEDGWIPCRWMKKS